MGSFAGTCEIVEEKEDSGSVIYSGRAILPNSGLSIADKDLEHPVLKLGYKGWLEDDINQLFESINIKTSGMSPSDQAGTSTGPLEKIASKNPSTVGVPRSPGTVGSKPVSLKEALRDLCISKASEVAAMRRVSEAGRSKNLYGSVLVESENRYGSDPRKVEKKELNTHFDSHLHCKDKVFGLDNNICPLTKSGNETAVSKSVRKLRLSHSAPTSGTVDGKRVGKLARNVRRVGGPVPRNKVSVKKKTKQSSERLHVYDEIDGFFNPVTKELLCHRCQCALKNASKENDNHCAEVFLLSLDSGAKSVITGANKYVSGSSKVDSGVMIHQDVISLTGVNSGVINSSTDFEQDSFSSLFVAKNGEIGSDIIDSGLKSTVKEASNKDSLSRTSSRVKEDQISLPHQNVETGSGNLSPDPSKTDSCVNNCNINREIVEEDSEENSTCTSVSEGSNASRTSFGNRPHMSNDMRWEAIQYVRIRHGILGLRHFNLLKKLGCGDIGTVYLAELIGTNCLFGMKVMDNEFLQRRQKMPRAQTEREILRMLDHPFLPTLYAHFTSDNLSCLVMEYCPGGDLHVLRQKQPARRFPEPAARFYVAEVLLALEYLHMQGVIYRDLKPENILVREDGHIMVTDFDLSLRCTVNPTLLNLTSPSYGDLPVRLSGRGTESSCIDPFCIQPSLRVRCFIPKLLSTTKEARKTRKPKRSILLAQFRSLPQLVAEPTDARSNSFVGTHEYLAPEIIKREGHGAAVDWWTFGVFLYELLYGRTPFKGSTNEETLANVVLQNLKFPEGPLVSFQAKDLIRGLLVKDPEHRLGSEKGAAEIKRHPFFEGFNWALIRCAIPPELPDFLEFGVPHLVSSEDESNFLECKATGEHLEFEPF